MRQSGPFFFTKWCLSHQVDFRPSMDRSYSQVPLMVTGEPLLINWEIHPLKMKISLVCWIVSTETDPKDGGDSLLEPHPGVAPADKGLFKETTLTHLTFNTIFLLALGSGKRRSEIHAWQNKNIKYKTRSKTGQR